MSTPEQGVAARGEKKKRGLAKKSLEEEKKKNARVATLTFSHRSPYTVTQGVIKTKSSIPYKRQ